MWSIAVSVPVPSVRASSHIQDVGTHEASTVHEAGWQWVLELWSPGCCYNCCQTAVADEAPKSLLNKEPTERIKQVTNLLLT
ncbi:hypothetical protein FIBSPDRAFT_548067 [Athelia psychrophila]|uniref:Uncharacterized protein n=1 Tax=Athelia psychrophila TaxID=1759441 RepID=A0A167WML1_9AGAM|nr:hypothetical protein FIBSPDRAFT_324720 [Fibularhizoctonia sp. CBS 109695]KZP31891.1 hypothetical protein FIBSPDRAFT_548067 [Fibularhizoctonia sp. CBS 109695]